MPNVASESTELDNGSRYPWLWGLVGLLTLIGIVVVARRYSLLMSPGISADSVNPAKDLDANFARHRGLTLAHIVPAVFYIALLPFQFTNRLRILFPRLHRWNGRVLVGIAGNGEGAPFVCGSSRKGKLSPRVRSLHLTHHRLLVRGGAPRFLPLVLATSYYESAVCTRLRQKFDIGVRLDLLYGFVAKVSLTQRHA
jgi:hypothetical protein